MHAGRLLLQLWRNYRAMGTFTVLLTMWSARHAPNRLQL
jgi:hypothetical protein